MRDKVTPYNSDLIANKISKFIINYIAKCIDSELHENSSELNYSLRRYCRALEAYYNWIKISAADQFPNLRNDTNKVHSFLSELLSVTYSDKFRMTGTFD